MKYLLALFALLIAAPLAAQEPIPSECSRGADSLITCVIGEPTDSVPDDTMPPPPPPPPPPPNECTDVALPGELQSKAAALQPGQVLCLGGTHTVVNAVGGGGRNQATLATLGASGVESAPLVLRGLPGSLILGDSAGVTNLVVVVRGDYWRVENLTFRFGYIRVGLLGDSAHDIAIVGNDIGFALAPDGNFGMIAVADGGTGGPRDIFVEGNHVHDLLTCESNAQSPCVPGGAVNDWRTFSGENEACLMVQGAATGDGEIVFRANRVERCSSVLYFKREGTVPLRVLGNVFIDASALGRCRGQVQEFADNMLVNVSRLDQASDRCETRGL